MKSYLLKYELLVALLRSYDSFAVAFSGGVDSTLLLKVAIDAVGKSVVAITSASSIHAAREVEAAKALANSWGIRHILFDPGMMDDDYFTQNSPDRCYHCKRRMFKNMEEALSSAGVSTLVHGVNCDDLSDYRPGLKAADELGVLAPMVEVGLTKKEIRELAAHFGLDVATKPAMSCLATRIPYGDPITSEALRRIQGAESFLYGLGFSGFRVRHHGDVARIEFTNEDLHRLFNESLLMTVAEGVKAAGYLHVAADLEGYGQGRMNRSLA